MSKKYEIGLMVIYTGEYFKYFDKFWETFKKYFCGGEARLYVLTDRKREDLPDDDRIVYFPINEFHWPVMPLLRWHAIKLIIPYLEEKYIYLIDGDAYFNQEITLKELKINFACTLHRNITRKRKDFNYETRPESTAYVADNEGEKYFACGFVG